MGHKTLTLLNKANGASSACVCLCVYAFVREFVRVFGPECVLVCAVRCFAFYVMVVEVVVEA